MSEVRTDLIVTTDYGEKIHLWLGERYFYGLAAWERWAYRRQARWLRRLTP